MNKGLQWMQLFDNSLFKGSTMSINTIYLSRNPLSLSKLIFGDHKKLSRLFATKAY